MRVIAGKYRGKKLYSPVSDAVRPTTDRIKETIFNILQLDVPDAVVIDLFAGSGALGIESLSRGAKEVLFCDKDRDSIALINMNLNRIDGNFRVVAGDFMSTLHAFGKKADIIFVDPPYGGNLGEIAVNTILHLDILSEFGIIVYEHPTSKKFELAKPGYKTRTKIMGSVTAEFIRRSSVAMVTGSFDPITIGHEAVIDAAMAKYDRVIVACLINPEKEYLFTPEERLVIVEAAISDKPNVTALFSEKTATEVAKENCASVLVRGVRDEKDVDYENAMKAYNLSFGYDTEFVEIGKYREITSTSVREEIKKGEFCNIPETAKETVKNILNR